jgi:phospholipid/cholesterol/gamma-HCH transport system substrate-binding protein
VRARRHQTQFAVKLAGSIAFALASAAIFIWLFTMAGGQLPFSNEYPYGVQAVVPSAVELAQNADVREAGVKVGRVSQIANRGSTAVLQLEIDGAHAPIYKDATVRIRTKSLVGENYVELDPGAPQAGRVLNGGVLPISNALGAVQVDQILSALDANTRARLKSLLDSLGSGLAGNGGENLNRLLETSSGLVSESAPALDVLGPQREDVATVVDDLGRVMGALGDRASAIRILARQLQAEAQAVAARDARLAATLDVLPSTLRQARATATHLASFSRHATPVLGNLTLAFHRLVPAVDVLGPASIAGRAMLDELGQFDHAGAPMLAALSRFATSSYPFAPRLDGFLVQVNPLLRYMDGYSPELGAFFGSQRSITSSVEGPGRIGRVHAEISTSTLASYPTQLQSALKALLQAGSFGLAAPRGNNAYPLPGEMSHPAPFSGTYPRLIADNPAVAPGG